MEELIDKIIDLKEQMEKRDMERKHMESERERLLQQVSSLFIDSYDAILTELPDRSLIDRIIQLTHTLEMRDTRMESIRDSYIVELCDLLKESPPKEPIHLSAAFHFMDKKTNLTEPHVEEAERMHLERRHHTIREALSPNVQSKSNEKYNALMKQFERRKI